MIINRSHSCPYCGDGHLNSCYLMYENGDYCFSCHQGSASPENMFIYKTLKLTATTAAPDKLFIPPHTMNPKEFSVATLRWLADYYIYEDTIKQYSVAYSASNGVYEESLLFPVSFESPNITNNVTLCDFQRRFFPSKKFYSSPNLSRCIFELNDYDGSDDGTVVLVEDYISAIRVADISNSICLFGTDINDNKLRHLMHNYSRVLVWLDEDEPGQIAAKEVIKKIIKTKEQYMMKYPYLPEHQRPIDVHNICNKQPKELSPYEIKNILNSFF